jgi:hypothetical protein
MLRIKMQGLTLAVIGLSLSLFVPACLSVAPQSTQAVQVVYPTVLITQYITQVVATPTIMPTSLPTTESQETPSVVNIDWDPFAAPIYYPIVGCVASRLHVGDVAFAASNDIDLHSSKDISFSPVERVLQPAEMVDITKGPWCDAGSLIWKVQTADGKDSFAPEGNGELYVLLPMPPGTKSVVNGNGINTLSLLLFKRCSSQSNFRWVIP